MYIIVLLCYVKYMPGVEGAALDDDNGTHGDETTSDDPLIALVQDAEWRTDILHKWVYPAHINLL